MNTDDFRRLIGACSEVAEMFPDGAVFIGGIAVYLHAINHDTTKSLAETTHDADFYISLADMGDLRDIEELTPNRQLSKHQMFKHSFEFDIYTERHSSLSVPYDAVAANSVVYDRMRVAALEELLVLKLRAYEDRFGTVKGEKDARDLMRIALVAHQLGFAAPRAAQYLGDEDIAALRRVERSSTAAELAGGNAQQAKQLRQQFAAFVTAVQTSLQCGESVAPTTSATADKKSGLGR